MHLKIGLICSEEALCKQISRDQIPSLSNSVFLISLVRTEYLPNYTSVIFVKVYD